MHEDRNPRAREHDVSLRPDAVDGRALDAVTQSQAGKRLA